MKNSYDLYRLIGIIFTALGAGFMMLFMVLAGVIGTASMIIPSLAVSVPFAASGIGMWVFSEVGRKREARLRLEGHRVLGSITGFLGTGQAVKGEMMQQAVVHGDNGRRYVSAPFRFSSFDWEVGDRIVVLVDPADPSKFIVDYAAGGPQDLPRGDDRPELEAGPMFPQLPPDSTEE